MWVRTSTASYGSFILDMGRSPGFGSASSDCLALLRLGFPSAPYLKYLTLPDPATRRTVLQKVRGRTHKVLPQFVNTGFQVLFHSPPGVLFTFPSRYCSSIGHQVVFRLGGWSPQLPTGFHVSRGTLDPAKSQIIFVYRTLTVYGWPSQTIQLTIYDEKAVRNPRE